MYGVWENLLGKLGPDPALDSSHWGEALRVLGLQEALLPEVTPAHASESPHWEVLSMRRVRESLLAVLTPRPAPQSSHQGEALQVWDLWEALHLEHGLPQTLEAS